MFTGFVFEIKRIEDLAFLVAFVHLRWLKTFSNT